MSGSQDERKKGEEERKDTPPKANPIVTDERSPSSNGEILCSICRDSVNRTTGRSVTVPCQHEFHSECIDTWFQRHSSCPDCRAVCNSVRFNFQSETEFETRDVVEPADSEDPAVSLSLGMVAVADNVFLVNMFPIPVVDIISMTFPISILERSNNGEPPVRNDLPPRQAHRLTSRQLRYAPDISVEVNGTEFPLVVPMVTLFANQLQNNRLGASLLNGISTQGSSEGASNAASQATTSEATTIEVSHESREDTPPSPSVRMVLMQEIRLTGGQSSECPVVPVETSNQSEAPAETNNTTTRVTRRSRNTTRRGSRVRSRTPSRSRVGRRQAARTHRHTTHPYSLRPRNTNGTAITGRNSATQTITPASVEEETSSPTPSSPSPDEQQGNQSRPE